MFNSKKTKLLIMAFFVLSLGFSATKAFAANKEALITKLMDVSGFKKDYQKTITVLGDNLKQVYMAKVQQEARKEKIPMAKTEAISETTQKATEDMIEEFKQYIQKELPFDKLTKEIYYPIYDKYFSAEEIEELIKFYNTSAGKKMVEAGPEITKESAEQFNSKYYTKLLDYMNSLVDGEFEKIKPEIVKLGEE